MILTGRILGNRFWRENLRCAGEKKRCFFIRRVDAALFRAFFGGFNLTIFAGNKVDHIVGDLFYVDIKSFP